MEEKHFAYWINNVNGVGIMTINKLFNHAGTYKEIWDMNQADLEAAHLGLTQNIIEKILNSKDPDIIMRNYTKMCNKGIQFIHKESEAYPDSLRSISNPPSAIYVLGSLPNSQDLSVAIVGARNCSEYGRYMARKIGQGFAKENIQVISGLAYGVDVIAQKGALDAGGKSYAVLGSGVDICYPPENQNVYNVMSTNGGIISEYPPGTAPKASLFPARNRIISALADIVIVIEARERSGSLITADMALEQGKEIYALPGRVTDSLSHGCNRLIRQGAGIILSYEELIQDIRVNYSLRSCIPVEASDFPSNTSVSETGKKILSVLSDFDPKSLTAIQSETNIDPALISKELLDLLMCGQIKQVGTKYIKEITLVYS